MKAILIILQLQKNPLITLDKLRTLLIFLLLLLSCDFNYESNDNIVARAGEKTLTNEELIEKLPKIINSEDSLIISNKIINDWALNQLLIKNAEINLSIKEVEKIEKISREYYNDLLISTYKNKVASYNSDTLVLDDEISEYYNSNFDNFLLYEDIIKGRYVRLNKNNFNLNEIKRRFRRFNEQDLTFFDSIFSMKSIAIGWSGFNFKTCFQDFKIRLVARPNTVCTSHSISAAAIWLFEYKDRNR